MKTRLHKVDDRFGKGKILCLFDQRLASQSVLNHELRQVADDFARWRNLDDVAECQIRLRVHSLHLVELLAQAQREGLNTKGK